MFTNNDAIKEKIRINGFVYLYVFNLDLEHILFGLQNRSTDRILRILRFVDRSNRNRFP